MNKIIKFISIIIALLIHLKSFAIKDSENDNDVEYISCPKGYLPSIAPIYDYNQGTRFRCQKPPSYGNIKFALPFKKGIKIKCSQGNLQMGRSHSHDNIKFAVDLHTLEDTNLGIITAAQDGIAYVYDKCPNPKENYVYDNCGSGYGNHVRIIHKNGYLSIYAHLSKILIKNGKKVKKYDEIGIEGMSGNAGKKQLHFGVHKPTEDIKKEIIPNPGYVGKSIPFVFENLKYDNYTDSLNVKSIYLKSDVLMESY